MYLDDTVVFLESPQDHIEQVRCVLQFLYESGVTITLKKRTLFVEKNRLLRSHFLGWLPETCRTLYRRCRKTRTSNKPDEASFFFHVFVTSLDGFCQNCTRLAPLKKSEEEPTQTFQSSWLIKSATAVFLKEELFNLRVLALPRMYNLYTQNTDAWDKQIRRVLLQ